MANQVSALMFQMLGELIAWLVVLRASVQPCTKKQQTHTQKVAMLLVGSHIHSLWERVSINSKTLCFFHFGMFSKYTLPQTQSYNNYML